MQPGERGFDNAVGSRLRRHRWLWLAALVALTAWPSTAGAATLYVTTRGSDANRCTRAAPCRHIGHAVAMARAGDRIELGRGRFVENVTLPARLRRVAIDGAGSQRTGVSARSFGSVFTVDDHATLADLSIGNGSASAGGGVDVLDTASVVLARDSVAFSSAIFGGGVFVEGGGSLTVTDSAIFSNQAGFEGGGIYVGAGSGKLRMTGSSVYQNLVTADGGSGAGLFTQASGRGPGLLANSTIAFNTVRGANGQGGGIFGDGLALDGDTIADNSAVSGGGLYVDWTPSTAFDTIVAGNRGGNCSSPFRSTSYDLEDDSAGSCGFSVSDHDVVGTDPQLGGLAANGGPSETMALSPGSAAIGDGDCAAADRSLRADVDQRGRPRRFAARGVCDIGAWDSGGSMSGLVVQTGGMPDATVGLPYRLALQASGGVGRPYTWSVTSGALPPGLTLSAGGVISGTPARAGTFTFGSSVTDSALPRAHAATQSLALTVYPAPRPQVWVANPDHIQLDAFALPARRDVAPDAVLSGHLTGVVAPDALVFDARGDLYVADTGLPAVWIYQSGAAGDVPPSRTITGPSTGLVTPAGIALGPGPTLYVANEIADTITEYSARASGDAAPLRTLAGPRTGLADPRSLSVDRAGHLWVADYASGVLTEYSAGAHGDAAPMRRIAAGSAGVLAGLSSATGFGVDAAGRRYVAGPTGVSVFKATRGRSPARVIEDGPVSGLTDPAAAAVTPPLIIASTQLPDAVPGEAYHGRLMAVLGQPPLRWRMAHGRLPAGLRLSQAGLLSGHARRLGTARFTVAVIDSSRPRMRARARIVLRVSRRPVITEVHPRRGPPTGGRRVTVVGRNLGRGASIAFGAMRAVRVSCVRGRRCTAWTPPHPVGAVRISATVDGVSSLPRRAPAYRFR